MTTRLEPRRTIGALLIGLLVASGAVLLPASPAAAADIPVDFGGRVIGFSHTQPATVSVPSGSTVELTLNPTGILDFEIVSLGTCAGAEGPTTCSIPLRFTPAAPGLRTQTMFVLFCTIGSSVCISGPQYALSGVGLANAVDDAYSVRAGEVLEVAAPGVLTNDDLFGLTGGVVFIRQVASNGVGHLVDDGSVQYTPNTGFVGVDTMRYCYGTPLAGCQSDEATVTFNVVANTPPVADDASVTATANTPLPITLTGSDTDGDSLTFAVGTGPSHGTLSGTAPNLTYTPTTGFGGSDSLTFTVDDGHGGTDTGTVSITVAPIKTQLTVTPPIVLRLLFVQIPLGSPQAQLRDANGAPVAGAPVAFRAGATPLCTGVTNAGGVATCSAGGPGQLLAVVLAGSVQASYGGSPGYQPSTGSAPLISL